MNWATLGSTPFRRFKHFTHEGGIAVPLIAHWPRGIPARRHNALVREPAHLVDVMPTILEVAGAVDSGHLTVSPKLEEFSRRFPNVVLDITTEDDSRRDLVAARFDAGIHLGEFVQRDMVAVRVSRAVRAAVVGSPAYFESHPKPKRPQDLMSQRCIRYRTGPTGPIYRWEFEKRGKEVTIAVEGPLVVDDVDLTLRAALDGIGLAFTVEEHAAPHVARGALIRVLEDWCAPFDGWFLYYPTRRQQTPALQALVDTLRV